MERSAVENIRQALAAARTAAQSAQWNSCDVEDIEEIIAPVEAELAANLPNLQTLATYLNSLARSLRAEPKARSVVMQLDAAMRGAGVVTNWEH
jgi:hypothetical protein